MKGKRSWIGGIGGPTLTAALAMVVLLAFCTSSASAAIVVPEVAIEAPTELSLRKATLRGSVNPNKIAVTSCAFEYFPEGEPSAAQTVPCEGAVPTDEKTHPVDAKVSGLNPEGNYSVRIIARNALGENASGTRSFQTAFAEILPPTEVTTEGAKLRAAVTPEGATIESCVFEYVDLATFETELFHHPQTANCEQGSIGTGNAPVPVSVKISGLSHGVQYVYRVSVNVEGTQRPSETEDVRASGPLFENSFVASVGATQAQLVAEFNPRNESDLYVFEYVSEGQFALTEWAGASQAPEGGANAPQVNETVEVLGSVSGLAPKTTYRFRLRVVAPVGSFTSTEGVFTTFSGHGSTALPDHRAYEQASPVGKNGNSVQGAPNHVEAAAHGARITYYDGGGIPGGQSSVDIPSFVSSRGSDGWTTKGMLPPRSTGPRGAVVGWNEDLTSIITTNAQFPRPLKGNLYEQNTDSGAFEAIATQRPGLVPSYVDSSTDGSTVAFEELAPAPNVSVFSRADDQVHPATILNDGLPPEEGAVAGPYNWFEEPGAENGGASGSYFVAAENALSSSGDRLYFTGVSSHAVFSRVNPAAQQSALVGGKCIEGEKACTTEVSAGNPAAFIGASPDGSTAILTSHANLTGNATTGPGERGTDLYLYEAGEGKLKDLTVDERPSDPNGAEVVGVLGHSNDMSTIYFVANGILAPGSSDGNCAIGAAPGSGPAELCNSYVWHDGAIRFIGSLKGGNDFDQNDWRPVTGEVGIQPSAQVAPNGEAMLFSSVIDQGTGVVESFRQLYRYSLETGETTCISCSPSGAAYVGSASVAGQPSFGVAPKESAAVIKRNLVDEGNRVFFDTPNKLVEADENGVNDVYEWEAPGIGTCAVSEASGCVSLISTGTSPVPSYFADSDVAGENVFFFTFQPLVAQDGDELADVYDARENGGIAAQNLRPVIGCEGEACRGGAAVPPPAATPGSSTLIGAGNPKPKKVKPHKKRHQRNSKKKPGKKKHGKRANNGKKGNK